MSQLYTDAKIGKMIRNIRILNGFTQSQLSQKIGITFQQLQKYESGTNRVCVSRLIDICKALNIDITTFFKNFDLNFEQNLSDENSDFAFENKVNNKEVIEVVRSFNCINDPNIRKSVSVLLKKLSLTQ